MSRTSATYYGEGQSGVEGGAYNSSSAMYSSSSRGQGGVKE